MERLIEVTKEEPGDFESLVMSEVTSGTAAGTAPSLKPSVPETDVNSTTTGSIFRHPLSAIKLASKQSEKQVKNITASTPPAGFIFASPSLHTPLSNTRAKHSSKSLNFGPVATSSMGRKEQRAVSISEPSDNLIKVSAKTIGDEPQVFVSSFPYECETTFGSQSNPMLPQVTNDGGSTEPLNRVTASLACTAEVSTPVFESIDLTDLPPFKDLPMSLIKTATLPSMLYKCPVCNKEFYHKNKFRYHYESHRKKSRNAIGS